MRELKRVVCIVVLHTEGDTVMANMLEFDTMPSSADASLALSDMEKVRILYALEQSGGNRKLAAGLLDIWRTTLYSKMKQFGINDKEQDKNIAG